MLRGDSTREHTRREKTSIFSPRKSQTNGYLVDYMARPFLFLRGEVYDRSPWALWVQARLLNVQHLATQDVQ